jgi:protein-L-isoaspartate(D-aspartate) O-methyltransferase
VIFDRQPARRALSALGDMHARPRGEVWKPVPQALDRAIAEDRPLAEAALAARRDLVAGMASRLAGLVDPEAVDRFADALLAVPRERFVLPEEIGSSTDDMPSPLDPLGLATVSAPHAYVLTYAILDLSPGDHLVELGTGTGYGAALASHIVGPRGRVTSIEIDPFLHARAARLLADPAARGGAPIELLLGDGRDLARGVLERSSSSPEPLRVAVTYALSRPPDEVLACLPEGARLVAPVGEGDQILVLWSREHGALRQAAHGPVRYVAERA